MRLQLTRPLVVFDLETTGLEVATARIVEVGLCRINPDGSTDRVHAYFNPGIPIPPETTAIHGITDEQVASAPAFAALAHWLLQHIAGCDLAGFNCLAFDIPVLWHEFGRAGISWNHREHQVIDAGNIFKIQSPRTLEAAVRQYLSRTHVGAHSAFEDATVTAEVLLQQVTDQQLPETVGELAMFSNHGRKRADVTGKFIVNEAGDYVINFSGNRGQLAKDNHSFLHWMLGKDFPSDAHDICNEVLQAAGPTTRTDDDLPF